VLVIVLGFAFIIARHDEYAALKGSQETTSQNKAGTVAIPAETDEQHPQENPKYSYWDSPGGHIFHSAFSWSGGTTIWAIILTLLAISEQTGETRRSVQVGLRPRLIVHRVWLSVGTIGQTTGVPDAHPWSVKFDIANVGGSVARVTYSNFTLSVFKDGLPTRLIRAPKTGFKPFSLEPGEDREMAVMIGDGLVKLFRTVGVTGPYLKNQETGHVYLWGYAKYRDTLGIARNIAVCRHYQSGTGKFAVVDDPERDYAD
jgi:hypothetical protein